tara:strand:+ start:576 stop:1466 length:891 start_codon:yes stop_codon:yes gene_type:complete
MKEVSIFWIFILFLLYIAIPTVASTVVQDGKTAISEPELRVLLKNSPPSVIRELKAGSPEVLWEFLNELIKNKRIASETEKLSPDKDEVEYLSLALSLQTRRLDFMEKKYLRELKLPDFSDLARERYDGHKDEVAKIPEARRSSHILLACNEACDPMQKIEEGRKLRERLVSGERFETLVDLYSGDPGSRRNKGKIDAWIERLDGRFVREYVKGLYSIENVGDYSKVVVSKYGTHIIRLDETRSGYLSFKEVKATLIKKLEQEYRDAKLAQYRDSFSLGESTKIYPDTLKRILNEY